MFNLKERPYQLLPLIIIILLVISFFLSDQILDIHVHDTYLIISMTHLFWVITILLLIPWILYLSTKHLLFSKTLTWIHIVLAVASSLLLAIVSFYANNYYYGLAGMPRRYYDYNSWDQFNNLTKTAGLFIMATVTGLVIYIINLSTGLIKNK
ncbi:MAG: hypothetical protein QM791_03870 [Ferruginibacter sp.]